jgi:hypothetical protein
MFDFFHHTFSINSESCRKIDNMFSVGDSACTRLLAVETARQLRDVWVARRFNSHAQVQPPHFIPAYPAVSKPEAQTKFIQRSFLNFILVGQDDQSEQVVAVVPLGRPQEFPSLSEKIIAIGCDDYRLQFPRLFYYGGVLGVSGQPDFRYSARPSSRK